MKQTSNVKLRSGAVVIMLALLLALAPVAARADEPLNLDPATQPLNEGVPQVAVVRLRALLATDLPEAERTTATARLAEALIAAGEPAEALSLLDGKTPQVPNGSFIRAQALAAVGQWNEALPLYRAAAADTAASFQTDAVFGQAEALRALGRTDEALQVLAPLTRNQRWKVRARFRSVEMLLEKGETAAALRLLESVAPRAIAERKERRFLRGSIEAKRGNRARAIELFTSILQRPEGATHPVLIATLFAIAEAHLQSGTPGAGDDFLEDFIERHPGDADLPAIFGKLDQLYAAERRQSRHELGRWANDPAQPRRALAQWYLARAELRLGRRDMAFEAFQRLQNDYPLLPALAPAFVAHAELLIEDGELERAIQTLGKARAINPDPAMADRVEFLIARCQFDAREFELAARTFNKPAQPGRQYANAAVFNASLAWLHAGEPARVSAGSRELQERGADEQMRGELLLEQGLLQAREGRPEAAQTLQSFLGEFPQNHRAAEAWIALAELAFHSAPPRLDDARQYLAKAAENKMSAAAAERADYLRIWIEDAAAAGGEAKVIALATEFVQKHPGSALLPDVRMKLAETYYRRQDFASAQTQFELLAQQNPQSAIAEKALFFAAQSATQSMGTAAIDRALVLFDEVVKRNGELKWAARNEQAVIERKLGQPQEALTLYEEVLRGEAKTPEKREALVGKADILYELGATDPENYKRAIALYDQLAAEKDVSAHWRNQVLFKKGMSLEKLGQPAEALATFYTIVEDEGRPARPREFFWFYKAGFNAARLLEESGKWQPAAAVYEKLAFAGGGRSEEAKARLNRIRLEHFLWEQ